MNQQLRVTKMMIDEYPSGSREKKNHMDYLVHYMEHYDDDFDNPASSEGVPSEALLTRKNFGNNEEKDLRLYLRIRYSFLGRMVNVLCRRKKVS